MKLASRDLRATDVIADLSRDFAAQLDIDSLLRLVIGKCRETLYAEGVSVLLLDRERNELYFPYQSEADPEAGARRSWRRGCPTERPPSPPAPSFAINLALI